MRLQKYISNNSEYSRRFAETLIKEGKVKVNGKLCTIPYLDVNEKDEVTVKGDVISQKKKKYYAFNKPVQVLSSKKGDGDKVLDYFKDEPTLRFAGRLDFMSEGLMIISNDGEFINLITHPRYEIEKEYLLFTMQDIKTEFINNFKKGVHVDGEFYKAKKVEKLNARCVKIILSHGKYREIRNVAAYFELPVARLIRVRIGEIKLKDLDIGEKRELSNKEINYVGKLKKSL